MSTLGSAPPEEVLSRVPVAVVGLGYVGLPLAVAFGRRHDVVGFDLDAARIAELLDARDRTGEVSPDAIRAARPALSVLSRSDRRRLRAALVLRRALEAMRLLPRPGTTTD